MAITRLRELTQSILANKHSCLVENHELFSEPKGRKLSYSKPVNQKGVFVISIL